VAKLVPARTCRPALSPSLPPPVSLYLSVSPLPALSSLSAITRGVTFIKLPATLAVAAGPRRPDRIARIIGSSSLVTHVSAPNERTGFQVLRGFRHVKTRFFHGEIAKDRYRRAAGKNASERERSFLARASKRVARIRVARSWKRPRSSGSHFQFRLHLPRYPRVLRQLATLRR